jgi:hypothetical protein
MALGFGRGRGDPARAARGPARHRPERQHPGRAAAPDPRHPPGRLAAAGAVQLSIGEATTGYLHVATDQTGEHAGCRRGDRSRISPAKCGQPDGLRLAKPALPP